jgi:phage tail-like protein
MSEPAQPQQSPGAGAPVIGTADPYRGYNFKVTVLGSVSRFVSCAGIGMSIPAVLYKEGGQNSTVRHLPGAVRLHPVTLRYGLTSSPAMWQWMKSGMDGRVQRQTVSVVQLADDGYTEVLHYDLVDAWVSEWHAAPLDALGTEIAIETLVVVYDSINRQQG